jgi:hypothetical protein
LLKAFVVSWDLPRTTEFNYIIIRRPHIFQKSRSHLKTLCARRATWGKFHIEDPQALGANIQNSVTGMTSYPGFQHPWS